METHIPLVLQMYLVEFKSYYVVWKLSGSCYVECNFVSLNRTM